MSAPRKLLVFALSVFGLTLLFGYALDRMPPVWWDEGWTLTVARTWVERGVYARLLDGQLAPPGLESAFPTTWLVALSMRGFGVGLAQARWVSVALTCGAIAFLFVLARRLFGRAAAWLTLGVLFLMTMHPHAHVLLNGRQVLGEAAMLFGLTAGLVLMLYLEKRSWLVMPAIGLCWGMALLSKGQPIPFWVVAMGGVMIWSAVRRRWRRVVLLAGVMFFTALAYAVFYLLLLQVIAQSGLNVSSLNGLVQVLSLVNVPAMRVKAIVLVVEFSAVTLCGLVCGGVYWLRARADARMENVVHLWVWLFAASWLSWFVLLANSSIPRYLYVPTFFGAMFAAAMLDAWTAHLNLRETMRRATQLLTRPTRAGVSALGAIVLFALAVPFTLLMLGWAFFAESNLDAEQTAAYLNAQTPAAARVETYEAELFFYLNRPYHYPLDQMHVEYIRRTLEPQHAVTYDALAYNPDYLVVGTFGKEWHVYDEVLASGVFSPTVKFGAYQVYARVR